VISALSVQRTAFRKNMKTKSFKDLIVWQKAYKLTLEIYKVTGKFPNCEQYGLTSQIRRAAVSIPSNIAEGYSRGHKAEYKQFLSVAYGSLAELQTQIILAKDLKYIIEESVYTSLATIMDEVGAMLYRMMNQIH